MCCFAWEVGYQRWYSLIFIRTASLGKSLLASILITKRSPILSTKFVLGFYKVVCCERDSPCMSALHT
jgi:hypothetical protein